METTNQEEKVVASKPKTTKKTANKELKITLVRSLCGTKPNQRATVEALGLKKINQTKIQPDNDAIRGMIFTVKHLVKVEEI